MKDDFSQVPRTHAQSHASRDFRSYTMIHSRRFRESGNSRFERSPRHTHLHTVKHHNEKRSSDLADWRGGRKGWICRSGNALPRRLSCPPERQIELVYPTVEVASPQGSRAVFGSVDPGLRRLHAESLQGSVSSQPAWGQRSGYPSRNQQSAAGEGGLDL